MLYRRIIILLQNNPNIDDFPKPLLKYYSRNKAVDGPAPLRLTNAAPTPLASLFTRRHDAERDVTFTATYRRLFLIDIHL